MNEEEGKQVSVEFLLNHLAVEDDNTQHRFLSQINSNSSMNMIAYDRRQNRGKSNKAKQQDWTLLQGMPVQEENQKSQSSPGNTSG